MKKSFNNLDAIEQEIYELEKELAQTTDSQKEAALINKIAELDAAIEDIYRA